MGISSMVGDLGPLFARKRSLKEKEIYGELVLKLFFNKSLTVR